MASKQSFFQFSSGAKKDIAKLDDHIRMRILKKMQIYQDGEDPMQYAEPLKAEHPLTHRFRIGDWRVKGIFLKRDNIFVVSEVLKRGKAYKQRKR